MTTLGCMTIVAPERGNPTIWLGIGSVPKLEKFSYQGNMFLNLITQFIQPLP